MRSDHGISVAPAHLRQPGQPRPRQQPAALAGVVELDLRRHRRARARPGSCRRGARSAAAGSSSSDRRRSSAPGPGDAVVAVAASPARRPCASAPTTMVRNLSSVNGSAGVADPALAVEGGPGRVAPHPERDAGHGRRQRDRQRHGQRQVGARLARPPTGPRPVAALAVRQRLHRGHEARGQGGAVVVRQGVAPPALAHPARAGAVGGERRGWRRPAPRRPPGARRRRSRPARPSGSARPAGAEATIGRPAPR